MATTCGCYNGSVTGTLGLFSLVDLFQLLASSKRTGRLIVDHPRGSARVYFDKGRVVHADFGDYYGEDAVYALFMDERGSFEFNLGIAPPAESVHVSTDNLILEAIRRLDEAERSRHETSVDEDAVPSFNDEASEAGNLTLQAHEVQILRFIDGQRDVSQLALASGLELDTVQQVVSRLVTLGALKLQGKKPRVARLVVRLASAAQPPRVAGIDESIVSAWERTLGIRPRWVACKRPSGRVDRYPLITVPSLGPFITFSRDTLLAEDLSVETPLLVKPVEVEA